MQNLIILTVILIQMASIQSQNPSCGVYDFNDPLILEEFNDCTTLPTMAGSRPLIIKSYSESDFEPFRSTSGRFLTTNTSVNIDVMQCLQTKTTFRVNFASMAFKMGYNLPNNETTYYNNFQFFVGARLWAQQLNSRSDGWESYERYYNISLDIIDDLVLGIRARIGTNSKLAVEYIKFYDPQITDENCQPLPSLTTQFPESTTDTSTLPPNFSSTVPPTFAPTTEISTTETDYPETETPGNSPYLKIDFNQSTSLPNHFQECYGQYLPGFIQKPYANSSVQPLRNTAMYYLSNKWEGLSCIESTTIFSLNETSSIETAIYLNGNSPGAWIEVYVIDVKSRERQNLINLQPRDGWNILTEDINGKYNNAQIVIRSNMNSYSQIAVEYLNIFNSENNEYQQKEKAVISRT